MHTFRSVSGSTREEALDPPHRPVNYNDDGNVRTVATRSRQIWLCRPEAVDFDDSTFSKPDIREAFSRVVRFVQDLSSEELMAIKNPDTFTTHTPLRDMVYHIWIHVFWDVAQFLGEVNCNTGTFDPPTHDVVAINYPETPIEIGEMQRVAELQFDCNIMLAAVFVAPGVKIRVLVGQPGQESFKEGDFNPDSLGPDVLFDASNLTGCYNEPYVHWIRRNRSIQVFLARQSGRVEGGLAAVFVYGRCRYQPEIMAHPCTHSCTCDQIEGDDTSEKRDDERDDEHNEEDKE